MFFNRKLRDTLFASVSAGTLAAASSALGNPLDPTVVTGDVTISGTGTDHVIIQNDSMRSVVDWDSFSIGSGETTSINQIANDAAILNRVTGGDISEIYGTLESNGQVYLINENGILIGESGLVDTGGFVASTLDVSNADFLGAGDMLFTQGIETGGGITVHGTIRSVTGGDIFLLSREIEVGETGKIESNGGYVGLGAGEEILLRPVDSGDGRISIRAGKGKIVNRGHVEAAAAELRAAGGNEYALAINNTGVVRANGVSKKGGRILLTGGGKVRNSGKLVARKKVIVRSKKQIINKGTVKAGGEKGGEIIFEAPEITIEAGSVLDVSGALGGGRMFVGGGYQGSGTDRDGNEVDIAENAQIVTVETGAVLNASATQSGDAGEVVVWSDGATSFAGDIVATSVDGAGGFAEVSGKKTLAFNPGDITLTGATAAGELLLDPENITIVSGDFATDGAPAAGTIYDDFIEGQLESGTSVTITTSGGTTGGTVTDGTSGIGTDGQDHDIDNTGAEPGDVTFEAGVRIIWTDNNNGSDQDALFTVHADRDINALDDVLIQHSEVGDGTTTFVDGNSDGESGVRFLAGRDINIGSATGRTGGVAIGSEFGSNFFVAGNAGFGNFPDASGTYAGDGDVNVIGGDAAAAFAQLGYILKEERANGTGNDHSNAFGSRAFNGSIFVRAGADINVIGGDEALAFAQIGHGGYNTAAAQTRIAEVSGLMAVLAGRVVSGDINISHAAKDSDVSGSSYGSHAQIGHGGVLVSSGDGSDALVHGDISGSLVVDVQNSDLNLNTSFTSSSDGSEDEVLSQLGHGGHLFYTGSGIDGIEATHGDIQGIINAEVAGAVNLGTSASAAAGDDRYVIQSQIGHGGHIRMTYDGTDVSGDGSLDADHGSVMTFRAVTNSSQGTGIIVEAAEFNVFAREATENSAGSTGLAVDNIQRSQIGHGMETVVTRGTDTISGGEVDPDAVISGGPLDSITLGELNDALGADAPTPTQQDIIDDFNSLSDTQKQELADFIVANTSDVTVTAGDTASAAGQLSVSVTERYIAGDITLLDISDADSATDGNGGLDISSTIAAGLTAIDHDLMIARVGHASQSFIDSFDGSNADAADAAVSAFNGGDVTIRQAHILDAEIIVDLVSGADGVLGTIDDITESDSQDVVIETSVSAGLAKVEDNTTVAQVGHSGDVYVSTGKGGDTNAALTGTDSDYDAAHGGDIAIYKGTIWDGGLDDDDSGGDGYSPENQDTTDITILTANEVIITSATSAALAQANRNNAESQIGHGHQIRLLTGNGGVGVSGLDGGSGGDVLIVQALDPREYGDDSNDRYDDYAYGIRGDIDITVREVDGTDGTNALTIESSDSSALAATNNNSDYSLIGHSDIIEIVTGDGGAGGDGSIASPGDAAGSADDIAGEGDDYDTVNLVRNQLSAHGGRGGIVDVQLGRLWADQDLVLTGRQLNPGNVESAIVSEYVNTADLGDIRARNLGGNSDETLQAVQLTEGDITVNAIGRVFMDSAVNNALSPANHAITESLIGFGHRVFADSGNGGAGGAHRYSGNEIPVAESELEGERFYNNNNPQLMNYTTGVGSNRGGNGGDLRLTGGDITDREIADRTGDSDVEFYHDTDADHREDARIIVDISDTYMIDIDGSFVGATPVIVDADHADSLLMQAAVNDGLGEGPGSDVSTAIGHRTRMFGEGGYGGDGGSGADTQFDGDGNSLYTDGSNQTDVQDGPDDGTDETATQAGAVFIQPNSSGGRGGDVLLANGNINGDIVVIADRRVTVETTASHGLWGQVLAGIGHHTHVFAATQNGGLAGNLEENNADTFDGGIINVGEDDRGDTAVDNSNFPHVLIDGNEDDQFNLNGIGDADSTEGEDGIAVTTADIVNRQGSTMQSVYDELGTLRESDNDLTAQGGTIDGINADGVQTYEPSSVNAVIFHDEEADPEFILDNDNNYVLNNEANNTLYAQNGDNLDRFGRVVAAYDGTQHQNTSGGGDQFRFVDYDSLATLGGGNRSDDLNDGDLQGNERWLEVFIDMDQDGDVDLVDFDRDGRLDIVDVDKDGRMDVIDGRANYVAYQDNEHPSLNTQGYLDYGYSAALPRLSNRDVDALNGITGLGVLDYVAVTGEAFDPDHVEGGWTITEEMYTVDLLDQYLGEDELGSRFTSIIGDFSTANGGRGGDAYTHVGYSIGDISVSTGDPGLDGEVQSLIVRSNLVDDVVGGGGYDIHRALIGHSAIQFSDAGADADLRRSGREGLRGEWDTHVSADGGTAGEFAVNASGGRSGDAILRQGVTRDVDPDIDDTSLERDHLVGDIFINTPNALEQDGSNNNVRSADSKQILISSFVDTDFGNNYSDAGLGHDAFALAFGGDLGGDGMSVPGGEPPSSQTEIANGGDGGDSYVIQHHLKGAVTVMAGADDGNFDYNYSLVVIAENGAAIVPGGPENTILASIGHGRTVQAGNTDQHFNGVGDGADGGNGDDGQLSGNGGDGGDVAVYQKAILDAPINITLVDIALDTNNAIDLPNSYFGNGIQVHANIFENSDNVVRSQIGHYDLAEAVAGNAGHGSPEWEVNEQHNQTANGGEGGDATIFQTGYNYDIDIVAGSTDSVDMAAVDVQASSANIFTGQDNHLLAAIGHGGLAYAASGDGGDGGLSGAVNGIQTDADPNLVDTDYNYFGYPDPRDDTPFATDENNQMVLGTDRRGGDAGDALVVMNDLGTGRDLDRDENNDYGDDSETADIIVSTYDQLRWADETGDDGILDTFVAEPGFDAIRIASIAGPGSNQNSALHMNTALIGHHGFGSTDGGDGGDGIQSALNATISEGDGGDGGDATTMIGGVDGDIRLNNISRPDRLVDAIGIDAAEALNDNDDDAGAAGRDTNIIVESTGGTISDALTHRAEARVGHLTHVEASGGDGGDASREAGAPPAFPAVISAQGGDGGDGTTYQGQLEGNIVVNAENSVIAYANDGVLGANMTVAAFGHRMEGRAFGGTGGYGGTVINDGPSSTPVNQTVSLNGVTYEIRDNGGTEYYCLGDTCYTAGQIDSATGIPTAAGTDGSGFDSVSTTQQTVNIDVQVEDGDGNVTTVTKTFTVWSDGTNTYYYGGADAGDPPDVPATDDAYYTGFDPVTGDPIGQQMFASAAEQTAFEATIDEVFEPLGNATFGENTDGTASLVLDVMTDGSATFYCDGTTCYTGFDGNGVPTNGTPQAGLGALTNIQTNPTPTPAYFIYEALREYHARSTANGISGNEATSGFDQAAYDGLSDFEKKLVDPFRDYFENKPGEFEVFLDDLIGNDADVIAANDRDDNFAVDSVLNDGVLTTENYTLPVITDEELDTMVAVMAASGHGGNGIVVQGSRSVDADAPIDELAASGLISLSARGRDITDEDGLNGVEDADRGIILYAHADALSDGMQLVHAGHQAEVWQIEAGDGQDLNGRNANSNGIGGDGGDAIVDQYALNGGIDLHSNYDITVTAHDSSLGADEVRAWVGHRLAIGSDHDDYRAEFVLRAGDGGSESGDIYDDGHNGNGGDIFVWQRGVVSGKARPFSDPQANGHYYDTEITLFALQDSHTGTGVDMVGDHQSITISAEDTGLAAPDVETHIGHDIMLDSARAGDAGRQGALTGPNGADEGLTEGNGGDIFVYQSDLGADIDILGRDDVQVETVASLGGLVHLMIGHERTIGLDADEDNPREGKIIAGFGGDSIIEDYNASDLASIEAAQAGETEDADSGRIEITLGILGDSYEDTDDNDVDDDERLINIWSIQEDVEILTSASLGTTAEIEIGNQQHVYAETQSASEFQGIPLTQTAGDAGGVYIARDDVYGDILIQALDTDRANSEDPDTGKRVVIDSQVANGTLSEIQIGHETTFLITTSVPVTARAAFGEDRDAVWTTELQDFVDLSNPALVTDQEASEDANLGLSPANTSPQATLADAVEAVEDMENIVRMMEMAARYRDRLPDDDGVDEDPQSADLAILAGLDQGEFDDAYARAQNALAAAKNALATALDNTGSGNATSVDQAIAEVQSQAANMIAAAEDMNDIFTDGPVPNAQYAFASDYADAGDITYRQRAAQDRDLAVIRSVEPLDNTGTGARFDGVLNAAGHTVNDTGVVRGDLQILSGRYSNDDAIDWDLSDFSGQTDVVLNNAANDSLVADVFGYNAGTGDFTLADDEDDGVVQISSLANIGDTRIELGHRRVMTNTTWWGGGDTDGAPEASSTGAGDGGSITTRNSTSGDVTIRAEEIALDVDGSAGTAEIHMLHSSLTQNYALGWSDIQAQIGQGGDISNDTLVYGGVNMAAEWFTSVTTPIVIDPTDQGEAPAVYANDRTIMADGLANTFLHLGHQVADDNISNSDPNETGNNGDSQDNLGSNRGGDIQSGQTVLGARIDNGFGRQVDIALDVNGDGLASDLIIMTQGGGTSEIRLGSGEDAQGDFDNGYAHDSVFHRGISGGHDQAPVPTNDSEGNPITITDDGGTVSLTQTVDGGVRISQVEDLEIKATAVSDSIWIGHKAQQFGQSGEINAAVNPQYGERVTVTQRVTGALEFAPTVSFYGELAGPASEWQIGHHAIQSAFSADDSASPSDFEDVDNNAGGDPDGIADNNGASADGVNDDFDRPDVDAYQLVSADISIITGEIKIDADGGDLQLGHEAEHIAAADGDLLHEATDANAPGEATGHVVAVSLINPTLGDDADGADIVLRATGYTGAQVDTTVDHTAAHDGSLSRDDGDIELLGAGATAFQIGHSSVSTMTDGTPGQQPEGQYDTLQAIGGRYNSDARDIEREANGVTVAETGLSVIELTAAQDIVITGDSADTHLVGHSIEEAGIMPTSLAYVDDDAASGKTADEGHGDSQLRQVIGSDILIGDNSSQGSGGTGAAGAGNTFLLDSARVGHFSPDSNGSQVEDGTRSVTPQVIDGDIIVEAGTDDDADAPSGGTLTTEAAVKGDETGTGDDIYLNNAVIGHNHAAGGAAPGANETQVAAGDVWVRAGGDLHVITSQIGHENYDFATLAVGPTNATPEGQVAGIRDRVRGNTTVGAGQNSAPEDSTLISDIMVFETALVNSGYGGQGDADVDGELRFFLPAQEGLTVAASVFNDSASAAGDPVPDRVSNELNIFENEGGLDHEHDFTFMSETAPYTDTYVGPANFTFYFESTPPTGYFPEYTPYINLIDLDPGFAVVFDHEGGPDGQGTVNMGELAGENYLGTSSFDVDCEEDLAGNLSDLDQLSEEERRRLREQCGQVHTFHQGSPAGFGSHWGFSATAGGTQTFGHGLPDDLEEAALNGSFGYAIPVSTELRQPAMITPQRYTANQNSYGVMTARQYVANQAEPTITSGYAPVIAGSMNEAEISYAPGESYGEYITGESANLDMQKESYPQVISYASSYTVFVQRPL